MNFAANGAHITCTAVNSSKNVLTLKFLKLSSACVNETGESHLFAALQTNNY